MKLHFPKKIAIGDRWFQVKTDKTKTTGEFTYWKKGKKNKIKDGFIVIGTKLLKVHPEAVLATIIHEIKEIIQEEQGTRYNSPTENANYFFAYDHKQHSDLCSRLSMAISQFLK